MPEDPKRPTDEADDDEDENDDEDTESPVEGKSSKTSTAKDADDADTDTDADDENDAGDSDEEDDEEEEPPPPPKKKEAKSAKADKPAPASVKKRPPPERFQLPPEQSIGAPSRQTLVMLGVMAFATLAMWGTAKFACNAHPAQTRKPREVSTQELARDPKDAALELQQRWNAYNFIGALELAKGSMAQELEKAQADCEKDQAACDAKRKDAGNKTLATAVLLDRGPAMAKVRVSSRGGALGEQAIVYQVEQDGSMWKVSGRTTADGPRLAPTMSGAMPTLVPPTGSNPTERPKLRMPRPPPGAPGAPGAPPPPPTAP
jgi:hypothetical protein